MGEWDHRLKVAIAAPPERGRANEALLDFLAEFLGIKRRDVEVVSGATTATKTIRVTGVPAQAIRDLLGAVLSKKTKE